MLDCAHMAGKEKQANPEQLQRLAKAVADVFIHRWDLYSKQTNDGRYVCVHKPLTQAHLETHLRGDITLGTYLLNAESNGRFLVLDADNEPDWRRLQAMSRALEDMDTQSYLERSRRGGHLWLFFKGLLRGREIREFGRGLLTHFNISSIELFPKQNELKTGPGSLVRLPFGVHRKSGKRYGFCNMQGQPLAAALSPQIMVLGDRETVPIAVFQHFRELGATKPETRSIGGVWRPEQTFVEASSGQLPSERIKATISIKELVSQYVVLTASGTGCCPFHDDANPSFSVNEEEGYWHCFACDKGGSVIDFWMTLHNCDFRTAIHELSALVPSTAS